MKNASKHAEELKTLYKKCAKEAKGIERVAMDPLRALVRGCFSFDTTDAKCDAVFAILDKEFVDLNELRVATDLEICEMVGPIIPELERRVTMATQSLNFIFEREHTLTIDRLKSLSKKEIRQYYRELPNSHPFVEAYVLMMGYEGSAVPVDNEILELLLEAEAVEEGTTLEDAQKFLENHLKSEEMFEFFVGARKLLESGSKKKAKA